MHRFKHFNKKKKLLYLVSHKSLALGKLNPSIKPSANKLTSWTSFMSSSCELQSVKALFLTPPNLKTPWFKPQPKIWVQHQHHRGRVGWAPSPGVRSRALKHTYAWRSTGHATPVRGLPAPWRPRATQLAAAKLGLQQLARARCLQRAPCVRS